MGIDAEYRLIQDGVVMCGASGPSAMVEVLNYGRQYIQDGPIKIEVKRNGKWVQALDAEMYG